MYSSKTPRYQNSSSDISCIHKTQFPCHILSQIFTSIVWLPSNFFQMKCLSSFIWCLKRSLTNFLLSLENGKIPKLAVFDKNVLFTIHYFSKRDIIVVVGSDDSFVLWRYENNFLYFPVFFCANVNNIFFVLKCKTAGLVRISPFSLKQEGIFASLFEYV